MRRNDTRADGECWGKMGGKMERCGGNEGRPEGSKLTSVLSALHPVTQKRSKRQSSVSMMDDRGVEFLGMGDSTYNNNTCLIFGRCLGCKEDLEDL